MRTSSCLTKTLFQASGYDVHLCSRSAADGRIPVLPPSLFFHHFLILAYPIPHPFPSVAVNHYEEICIKRTLQVDPELPRRAVLVACSRCPLALSLVTIGANTGTQRCQVAAWLYMPRAACPEPFSAYMRMLIAIAIVPRHSKARTLLTRLSFRCCKNGLAVFFLAVGRTTILRAAGFGATLGPDGGYSVAFQGLFSSLFGKIVA